MSNTVFSWRQNSSSTPLLYLRQRRVGKKDGLNLKRVFLMDILQLPLSLIFTRFMNLFSLYLPDFSGSALTERILVLLIAIALTGIGAAMSLNMRLVPNPGGRHCANHL